MEILLNMIGVNPKNLGALARVEVMERTSYIYFLELAPSKNLSDFRPVLLVGRPICIEIVLAPTVEIEC